MTTISKDSCDVKIYWLTQTMKRDVYAMMQKYYFVFYPYIFTRSHFHTCSTVEPVFSDTIKFSMKSVVKGKVSLKEGLK